jgi:hypothetical protein
MRREREYRDRGLRENIDLNSFQKIMIYQPTANPDSRDQTS